MYLAYKVIGGVMHVQSTPGGPWWEMSGQQLTQRILELERECRK